MYLGSRKLQLRLLYRRWAITWARQRHNREYEVKYEILVYSMLHSKYSLFSKGTLYWNNIFNSEQLEKYLTDNDAIFSDDLKNSITAAIIGINSNAKWISINGPGLTQFFDSQNQ